MIVDKIIFFCLFVCSYNLLSAQGIGPGQQQAVNSNGAVIPPRSPEINIFDPEHRLETYSIPYDQIAGSPFWKDSLHSARLYNNTTFLGVYPVRINLATNEIYFWKDTTELVLTEKLVTRVVFKIPDDSVVFVSQVPNMLMNNYPVDGFVQVLNAGNYQLLKYTRRKVVSVETPSHTAKTYHFADDVFYFIKSNHKVEYFRKLNKENILLFLPASSSYDNWIKENNINFKREVDIVRFLKYYNTTVLSNK